MTHDVVDEVELNFHCIWNFIERLYNHWGVL